MKSIIFISIVLNLLIVGNKTGCLTNTLNNDIGSVTYKEALKSFLKSEKKLMEHRKKSLNDKLQSDPLTEYRYWIRTFEKNSPEVLKNTKLYSKQLIKMLVDKTLTKDKAFDRDVIMVLYNLCIEDYSDVLQSIYRLYQEKKISFQSLSLAVDQDIAFNSQVAVKYQSPKLRNILNRIAADAAFMKFKQGVSLRNRLKDILSGKVWQEEAKQMIDIQPPIMKVKECN